jgi:hypothetical protein
MVMHRTTRRSVQLAARSLAAGNGFFSRLFRIMERVSSRSPSGRSYASTPGKNPVSKTRFRRFTAWVNLETLEMAKKSRLNAIDLVTQPPFSEAELRTRCALTALSAAARPQTVLALLRAVIAALR